MDKKNVVTTLLCIWSACFSFKSLAAPMLEFESGLLDAFGVATKNAASTININPDGSVSMQLRIEKITIPGLDPIESVWLHCMHAMPGNHPVPCEQGHLSFSLRGASPINARFSISRPESDYWELFATAETGHSSSPWQISATLENRKWHMDIKIDIPAENPLWTVARAFAPQLANWETNQVLRGEIKLKGKNSSLQHIQADMHLGKWLLHDPAYRYQTENAEVAASLEAHQVHNGQWRWRTGIQFIEGMFYIQPWLIEVPASKAIKAAASGIWNRNKHAIFIDDARIDHPGVGSMQTDQFQWLDQGIQNARGKFELDAAEFYTVYLQPWLIGSAADQLEVSGKIKGAINYTQGGAIGGQLIIQDLHADDRRQRFGIYGLSGSAAFSNMDPVISDLRWLGAHMYRIPMAGSRLMAMNGSSGFWLLAPLELSMLEGSLVMNASSSSWWQSEENPDWKLSAEIRDLSMKAITETFGLPSFQGSLNATIPRISYEDESINLDGTMEIEVFDGKIAISQLRLVQLFSFVPRLTAQVDLENMDLGLMTDTIPVGHMKGKIDGYVHNLELLAWQPVRFDARFTTDDHRPRRISQKALKGLISLGGAGIAEQLFDGFLGLFNTFRYEQIAFSCRLRGAECYLGGTGPAPNGGVYLLKGTGLPRVDIIAVNQNVDWRILISRIRSIISQGSL